MVNRKARPSLLAQILVVLLILIPICCLVWPVVRDSRGPMGEAIPRQPPEEKNRVHHPLGFSLVVPPKWDSHIILNGGPLVLAPMSLGKYARRSKASIVVTYLKRYRPPDIESLGKTSFLGQSAYEVMQVNRPWTFDDGAWSEYTLYLTHDGYWYEIRYGIAEERTQLPGEVRQYLNTLRWEEASHIVSPIKEPEQ
jgi:hypothetical protein